MKRLFRPFLLLVILVGGIFFIFIRVFTLEDQSGSLGIFIESFYWLSLILFFGSLVFLLIDFKKFRNNFLVWFHLVISSPLALILIFNFLQLQYFKSIETTTPDKYLLSEVNNPEKLNFLRSKFEAIPDSLVNKVIGIKSDSTSRYFQGQMYHDNIERKLSIDLIPESQSLNYISFKVDRIYQSHTATNYYSGIITSKYFNEYAVDDKNPEGIDFKSNIFIGAKKEGSYYMIILDNYSLGCLSIDSCINGMELNFLKGRSKSFSYNINDSRFWSENNWKERMDKYIQEVKTNVYNSAK